MVHNNVTAKEKFLCWYGWERTRWMCSEHVDKRKV